MKILENDIKIYIFALPNKQEMKRYKVSQIIKLLEQDGWRIKNWRGDHRQFIHPDKPGKVTVRGKPIDSLSQELLNSIFKQAGWK